MGFRHVWKVQLTIWGMQAGTEYGYGLIQPPSDKKINMFNDVEDNSWYSSEVNYLFKNGIVNGYEGSMFRSFCTRYES